MGTVIALFSSGWISASDFLGGWSGIFYVHGTFCLIVAFLFVWIVRDDPRTYSTISKEELRYILDNGEKYSYVSNNLCYSRG